MWSDCALHSCGQTTQLTHCNGIAAALSGLVLPCTAWPVPQWMAAVDTIITKAGPGTIAEALISGLPILLNGNVPCQVGSPAGAACTDSI